MRYSIMFLVVLCLCAPCALADEQEPVPMSSRFEAFLGISMFPALDDIRSLDGGEFDAAGLGLGGAWHFPVARRENSDILIGVDGFIAATGSNIEGFVGDVYARHLYLGLSTKWLLGERRNVSLDAGVGYHEIDMAELSDYALGIEREVWSTSTGGAYVGATWDVGAGRPDKRGGLSLGIRAHIVDFGNVHDDSTSWPNMFGMDAGDLNGPLYMLQVGYSSR